MNTSVLPAAAELFSVWGQLLIHETIYSSCTLCDYIHYSCTLYNYIHYSCTLYDYIF